MIGEKERNKKRKRFFFFPKKKKVFEGMEGAPARRSRKKRTMYDGEFDHPAEYVVDDPSKLAEKDSQFLELDGLLIHCVVRMKEEPCPVLVMLHGFSGNTTNFSVCPMWEELAQQYSLVAFDRPGWGLSPRVLRGKKGVWPTRSAENPYTYAYSCRLLRSVLEALHLWDAHHIPLVLIGHSHGGTTTSYCLAHDAQLRARFAAAVLIDAPLAKWPVPRPFQAIARGVPAFTRALCRASAPIYYVGACHVATAKLPFYDLRGYIAQWPNGMRGWDQTFRVRNWQRAFAEWCCANASRVEIDFTKLSELPVLDVRGAQDKVVDPQDGIKLQQQTKAEIAFVSNAGHLPFAEQPDDFMMILSEFLQRVLEDPKPVTMDQEVVSTQ